MIEKKHAAGDLAAALTLGVMREGFGAAENFGFIALTLTGQGPNAPRGRAMRRGGPCPCLATLGTSVLII